MKIKRIGKRKLRRTKTFRRRFRKTRTRKNKSYRSGEYSSHVGKYVLDVTVISESSAASGGDWYSFGSYDLNSAFAQIAAQDGQISTKMGLYEFCALKKVTVKFIPCTVAQRDASSSGFSCITYDERTQSALGTPTLSSLMATRYAKLRAFPKINIGKLDSKYTCKKLSMPYWQSTGQGINSMYPVPNSVGLPRLIWYAVNNTSYGYCTGSRLGMLEIRYQIDFKNEKGIN